MFAVITSIVLIVVLSFPTQPISSTLPPDPPAIHQLPDPTDIVQLSPEDFQNAENMEELANHISDVAQFYNATEGYFEGDIDLMGKPLNYFVDVILPNDTGPDGVSQRQHNAIRGHHYRWPNAKVPYVVSNQYSQRDRAVIASAIAEYDRSTCIRWVPRTNEKSYVYINKGSGCHSAVGKQGSWQELSLGSGCVAKGLIIHEMMHAVGFFHEQSRTDRDSYVAIYWNNIQSWAKYNFQRFSVSQVDDLGTDYDFGSIMHYGPYDFSKGSGLRTIGPLDPNIRLGQTIGQRSGFSQNDIYKINKLYGCPTKKTEKPKRKPSTKLTETKKKPAPTTSSSCYDRNSLCRSWSAKGECTRNAIYMHSYCKRSCNRCGSSGTGGGRTQCYDSHRHCAYWKGVGRCTGRYRVWMSQYCKKSCGVCR